MDKTFFVFHIKQHPKDLGKKDIEAFRRYLAVQRNVAASTQNQVHKEPVFFNVSPNTLTETVPVFCFSDEILPTLTE